MTSELPETMFRRHDFDDSTEDDLTPTKFRPIDEDVDDEWYES